MPRCHCNYTGQGTRPPHTLLLNMRHHRENEPRDMDVDTFPHGHVFFKVLKLHRILSSLNIIAFTIHTENDIQAANIVTDIYGNGSQNNFHGRGRPLRDIGNTSESVSEH